MVAPGLGNMACFRTRSEGSDRRADLTVVLHVIEAIERALNASKSKRDGLGRRVSDALSRAAMLVGNGTDEYIERETADTNRLTKYEAFAGFSSVLSTQKTLMPIRQVA